MATAAYVISAAVGVYATLSAPSPPSYGPAPPPGNYIQYDEDGNIIASQTYNPETNSYESRVNPEPIKPKDIPDTSGWTDEDWLNSEYFPLPDKAIPKGGKPAAEQRRAAAVESAKAAGAEAQAKYDADMAEWEPLHADWTTQKEMRTEEKAKIQEIKTKIVDDLNLSWDERVSRYNDFADAMSQELHKGVDEAFERDTRALNESMASRGLSGSRASVDLTADILKEKGEQEISIANQATMAKYALADQEYARNLNTLNYIESGGRADVALEQQTRQNIANTTLNQNAAALTRSAMNTNIQQTNYGNRLNRSQQLSNQALTTASGLMFLYGYNNPGTGGGGTLPQTPQPTQYSPAYNHSFA